MSALGERVVLDDRFQAACQRYGHGKGSSAAIAAAAMSASAADELLAALEAALAVHGDGYSWGEQARAAIAHATGAS